MGSTIKTVACLCLGFLLSGCDMLATLPQGGTSSSTVSRTEAALGIKQALGQGLDNSIETLSLRDGFLGNEAVKILMPVEAVKIEQTLRSIGLGSVVDDLIVQLNRAAETAVKEAAPVFVSALSQLTIQDAFDILLSGQDDAATQFFMRTTAAALTEKFSPIVQSAINEHQVARYWNTVISGYNKLPLGGEKIEPDLQMFVTQKAIEGLFYQVAQEERQIRNNLASRSTPLLKKVFAYADAAALRSK